MNRYQNIPKTKIDGNLVYQTSRYPEVPLSPNDIYVYTTQGDRFDILAQQYYKDSSLWWVISAINNNSTVGSMFPIPGTQLRIPTNINNVLTIFGNNNK